jgi:carboxypeptidase C (cathepsin A)
VPSRRQRGIGGATIDYIATTGHLNALGPGSAAPQASMFYVAYVRAVPAGTVRPLVFFYNGGPGSASVWLHLGSFAPRRIVTSAPATTVPQPFQLVDNAESLVDVADLVFVDAVGTGYSQAIAPFTNQTFWASTATPR